jgi:NTP pyrophosphatase (non-canonical NTP hydrolase)
MNTLISSVDRLRTACPWYQALTLESLRTYFVEEVQEVMEALDERSPNALQEELADVLFQILLYSQLASERGWFTMQGLINGLHHKIIRRNQHVFGDLVLVDLGAVNLHWQSVKEYERNLDVERTIWKMYEIEIEQNTARIVVRNHPVVTIPLEPPPAEKFAPGYTRSAWIWSEVNNTFERENIVVPEDDMKEIAILISMQPIPLYR